MEFKSLNSSNVNGVHHDPQSNTMTVEFSNKTRYTYHDVPADVHEDFINSDSHGKFFHNEIKSKYRATKIS